MCVECNQVDEWKHGLSPEQIPVFAYVGSSKNLKDLKDGWITKSTRTCCLIHQEIALKFILPAEREFFIDNLLVRIHLIIKMILADRSCAMVA